MREPLAIDAIVASDAPSFNDVQFDSKPAALRQLLIVSEVIESVGSRANDARLPVGVDIGSKYDDLRHILSAFGIRCMRLDVVPRGPSPAFVVARGERMPFPDDSIDFVVLSHVLAHVLNVDALMAEVERVLASHGAIVCLQANRFGWWKFWSYYLRRNDRAVHYRTFDVWDMRSLFARHGLEIRKMYAPYHFYLHAKYSDRFWRLDRRLQGRIPLSFATHWIAVGGHRRSAARVRVPHALPLIRALMAVVAVFHAVALKAIELAIRTLRRAPVQSEST